MIRLGRSDALLPAELRAPGQPAPPVPPGPYLAWLCSGTGFAFQFPKHIGLYYALRKAASEGATITGNRGMQSISLPQSVHSLY